MRKNDAEEEVRVDFSNVRLTLCPEKEDTT